jgi:hypothetical protein
VIGRRPLVGALSLDSLDSCRVRVVEVPVGRPERRALVGGDVERCGVEVGEREEVLDLDADASAQQCALADLGRERLVLACLPAVERRDGRKRAAIGHVSGGTSAQKSVPVGLVHRSIPTVERVP